MNAHIPPPPPAGYLCPHGQNKQTCLTCYHQARNQPVPQQPNVPTPPRAHGPSALPPNVTFGASPGGSRNTPKGPPGASYSKDKLWEPPEHPQLCDLQRPAR